MVRAQHAQPLECQLKRRRKKSESVTAGNPPDLVQDVKELQEKPHIGTKENCKNNQRKMAMAYRQPITHCRMTLIKGGQQTERLWQS